MSNQTLVNGVLVDTAFLLAWAQNVETHWKPICQLNMLADIYNPYSIFHADTSQLILHGIIEDKRAVKLAHNTLELNAARWTRCQGAQGHLRSTGKVPYGSDMLMREVLNEWVVRQRYPRHFYGV